MRPPMATALFVSAALLAGLSGCNSYRYIREATPLLEESRLEYVRSNPNGVYNSDILEGRATEGMSRLQVRMSWGDPDRVSRVQIDGQRIDEVWSYEEDEESRGATVYQLWFTSERLRRIEVKRAYLPLQERSEVVELQVEESYEFPSTIQK